MGKLFDRSNKLLTGVTYISLTPYKTFSHLKSIFKDGWYNFIIPQVSPYLLDWEEVKNLITKEQTEGYTLSYAVSEELLIDYRPAFAKSNHSEFGTDFYMFKTLDEVEGNIQGEFEGVNQDNLETFIELGKSCFPGWQNMEEYCRHFFRLADAGGTEKFINLLYKVGGEYVGFCSVVISEEDNLAYFHNTGVLENYRRKGYFSDMVNYRCKLVKAAGVTDCYALVGENSGSFLGLSKLGFKPVEKFYLFNI